MIAAFHFIRPGWLLALLPAFVLWWLLRQRTDSRQSWRRIVAPHLLPHLLSGHEKQARFRPLDLLGIAWIMGVIAVAGPAWQHEPTPFADDTAALAIVIKVSPSMRTEDVQPDRLTRATQKIHDLLKERAGAKTALIAYAGSAHVVMPATTDGGIIDTFARALDPKIMPQDGDAAAEALQLADQTLSDAGAGSILWVTDSIALEQAAPLAKWRQKSNTPVRLYVPLFPGVELDAVSTAAKSADATLVKLSADDADVHALAHAAKYSAVTSGDASTRWKESGYWLTPVLAALMIPFFRKGWMVATAARGR